MKAFNWVVVITLPALLLIAFAAFMYFDRQASALICFIAFIIVTANRLYLILRSNDAL